MAKDGTVKELIRFGLVGARAGKQSMFDINEYDNGVLIGTTDTVYEEIKDDEVTFAKEVVPDAYADKAKVLSLLVKGNFEKLERARELDRDICCIDDEILIIERKIEEENKRLVELQG